MFHIESCSLYRDEHWSMIIPKKDIISVKFVLLITLQFCITSQFSLFKMRIYLNKWFINDSRHIFMLWVNFKKFLHFDSAIVKKCKIYQESKYEIDNWKNTQENLIHLQQKKRSTLLKLKNDFLNNHISFRFHSQI